MAKAKANKKVGSVSVELPECPVCMETMSAPIFQCQSGHSLCNSCTRILMPPNCPICRQPMTQMRNWQLEDLISKATVPCPNKSSGCIYTMMTKDLENHLKECIFREMPCPFGVVFGRCSWSGRLGDILDHFKERHPNNCCLNSDIGININNLSISTDERCIYLIPQGKFIFILTFMIDTCKKMAYWVIQVIGSKMTAHQHVYEIHITSNQDDKRKVMFSDKCFNNAFETNEIFRQARCGVMPLNMLSHFIKDGRLTFNYTIKRNQPNFINKEKGNNTVKEYKPPIHKGPKGPKPQAASNQQRGKSPGPINFQKQKKN